MSQYQHLIATHLTLLKRHEAEVAASTDAINAEKKRILDALKCAQATVVTTDKVPCRDRPGWYEDNSSYTTFTFEGHTYLLLNFHGREKLRYIVPPQKEPSHGS